MIKDYARHMQIVNVAPLHESLSKEKESFSQWLDFISGWWLPILTGKVAFSVFSLSQQQVAFGLRGNVKKFASISTLTLVDCVLISYYKIPKTNNLHNVSFIEFQFKMFTICASTLRFKVFVSLSHVSVISSN